MTAPRRTASPHAKVVERIVEWSLAEGDYRDALRARILRLVARVERERNNADEYVIDSVRAIFDAEGGAEEAPGCESYLVRADLFEELGNAFDQLPPKKGAKR